MAAPEYTDIGQELWNKLNGPMYYKIDVTCVYNDTRYILSCNNSYTPI